MAADGFEARERAWHESLDAYKLRVMNAMRALKAIEDAPDLESARQAASRAIDKDQAILENAVNNRGAIRKELEDARVC